jgi:predicted phage terminase large subunit-like protein
MNSVTLPTDPMFYAHIAATILHRRRNDPWDGPTGTARPNQLPPPGDWQTWMILAGRGFGKTRSGAEYIRKRVQTGKAQRIVVAGPTAADIRDIMIEGESGLLAVCERAGIAAEYVPSKRRVNFPNGAMAILVSADEPKRFRGLQCDTFWADELASWRYPDAWDQLQLGHRLGDDPRGIVTTTPRPIPIIKNLLKDDSTVTTRGNTYENAANLADRFMEQVVKRYEGTTLGRQELYAEVLEDVEGALWTRALIDRYRVTTMPELEQVAVAIDPATTHGEDSDETGIAVAGRGYDKEFYVPHIAGYRLSPNGWANAALDLYEKYEADEIVVESNQGGEMTKHTILTAARDRQIRAPRVRMIHASRGKRVRAEPVVALFEQGKVHFVGQHASAEDQMAVFPVSEDLDDQVDALVHAIAAIDLRQPRGPIRGF